MANPAWVPGKGVYSEWLKTLSSEEKEAHLQQRRNKKTMRKAYEQVVMTQQSEWIRKINQGVIAVLDRAIRDGDPAALTAVFDRIIGKPVETLNTESNLVLPWNDTSNDTKIDLDNEDEPK
jgi:hypothetical protein